jgi:hypothetical protein
MNSSRDLWLAALSDEALLHLTSDAILARGLAYVRKGAVRATEVPDLRRQEVMALRATVQGSEPYATRMALSSGHQLLGECSCPHAGDGHFCKHQVALALTLRAVIGGAAASEKPAEEKKSDAAAKRAQTQAKNREALLAFLLEQDVASLADRLWRWAHQDRFHMNELKAWAAKDRAKDDPAALKSAVTETLRNSRGFLDGRDAGLYAAQASQVLGLLQPLLETDAAAVLDLSEHALRKLYKVAELADDSHGEIGDLIAHVVSLFTDALARARPPAKWLDRWLDLMKADPFGNWDEAAVMAVAGPAVQARYADKAGAEWAAWQKRNEGSVAPVTTRGGLQFASGSGLSAHSSERSRLRKRYLIGLALQTDDPRTVLEAMAQSAQLPGEWVDVVALCETHGWHREALQWAMSAHKLAPENQGLESALLCCYERDGWDAEALAIRRKRLNKQPTVAHYQECLDAAARAGHERALYREELMEWAAARELREVSMPPLKVGLPLRRETVRVVTVRVAWLLSDGDLDAAWALVQQPHTCDLPQMRQLARALPSLRDADAASLLRRAFEAQMRESKSPYTGVLALVREACSRMTGPEAQAWTMALRSTYKARRSFVAGLPPS